jgi:hypothetical protein
MERSLLAGPRKSHSGWPGNGISLAVEWARPSSSKEATVQTVKLGSNVTVFLLFFGLSLLDAVRSHDWTRALLWLALGFVFLRADALKPQA